MRTESSWRSSSCRLCSRRRRRRHSRASVRGCHACGCLECNGETSGWWEVVLSQPCRVRASIMPTHAKRRRERGARRRVLGARRETHVRFGLAAAGVLVAWLIAVARACSTRRSVFEHMRDTGTTCTVRVGAHGAGGLIHEHDSACTSRTVHVRLQAVRLYAVCSPLTHTHGRKA
jgi:hypothetical protein